MTTQKTTTTIETNMFNNFIFSRTNDSWGSENVLWEETGTGGFGNGEICIVFVDSVSVLWRRVDGMGSSVGVLA